MPQSALGSDAELSPGGESAPDVLVAPRLLRGAVIALVISVLAYAGLLLHADLDQLMREAARLSASHLAFLVAVSLVHVVLRCVRWQYYLRRLDVSVPWFDSALVCIAGFAMSLSPGKLGEVFKSLMLKRSVGVAIARTAPAVLAERMTDVAGLVLLCALALGVTRDAWGVAALLTLGVVGVGLITNSRRLSAQVVNVLSSPKPLRRHRAKLTQAFDSLAELMQARPYCIGTLLSVGAWGSHGVTLMLAANAFSGVHLSVLQAQLAYGAPLLAGTLAMLPGGVGLTEATMAGAITHLGGDAVPLAVATAITLIVRGITFWLTMILGVAALLLWTARRSARPLPSRRPPA